MAADSRGSARPDEFVHDDPRDLVEGIATLAAATRMQVTDDHPAWDALDDICHATERAARLFDVVVVVEGPPECPDCESGDAIIEVPGVEQFICTRCDRRAVAQGDRIGWLAPSDHEQEAMDD